jgi:hypothetical protein
MSESIDPELAAFEDDLRRLTPNAGRVDRDALLFEGGRAAAKAGRWRFATAGLAALSLALCVLLAVRPAPPVVERIVYIPVEPEEVPEPSPVAPPPAISRQALIDQVFLRGLDGLPDAGVEEAPALPPDWGAF